MWEPRNAKHFLMRLDIISVKKMDGSSVGLEDGPIRAENCVHGDYVEERPPNEK